MSWYWWLVLMLILGRYAPNGLRLTFGLIGGCAILAFGVILIRIVVWVIGVFGEAGL